MFRRTPELLTSDSNPAAAGIVAWWTENARELPWRATRDMYAVWVAEVMSAQTTVGRAVVGLGALDGALADRRGFGRCLAA